MASSLAKGVFPLTLLLFTATLAAAQDDAPPAGHRFGGGVMAGMNFSQVDGDRYGGYDALNGIAGLWLSRQFGSSHWSLRVELRYIGKGSRSVGLFGGAQGVKAESYAFTLHYVELPVYAEYTFLEQFSASVGLGAGYLFAWQERNAYGDFGNARRAAPKRYELSAHIALGWNFHRHWAVRGGFAYSILPIRGTPDDLRGQRSGQNNNMLYLLFQYEI